jgi:hypothetical protein
VTGKAISLAACQPVIMSAARLRAYCEDQEMARTNRADIQTRPGNTGVARAPRFPGPTADAPPSRMKYWMIGGALLLVVSLTAVVGFAMYQQQPGRKSDFAADRPGPAVVKPVAFDGKRAMGYLEAVCKIGTRMSGTDGMKKQQELLEKHFTDLGGKVSYQRFNTGKTRRLRQQDIAMANMIVSWYPDKTRRVILCTHYDTRPMADEEDNERLRRQPFISANDGGSGVALLMELAHHMKDLECNVGVDFVFLDGEEQIFDKGDDYFFGSLHFADEYRKSRGKPNQYAAAVLLDMVGGKKIHFPIEQNSQWMAPKLVQEVWGIAAELKCEAFLSNRMSEFPVEDDHLALNRAGIPAVDIIDFDYPHWHRASDVPANCSGQSLEQVAKVLSVWIQRTK